MANEQGRRAVVNDPLASGSTAVAGKGMGVQVQSIRNPGASGSSAFAQNMSALQESMAGLRQSVMAVAKEQTDAAITDGKLKYMQGVTEEEINRTGDKATQQGWQALAVADKANRWFSEEALGIQNGNDRMDPAEYQKGLMQRRADYLKNLPADPQIRAVYAAQFDDKAPRLVAAQMDAHNTYNKSQTANYFARYIDSSSSTNADAPKTYGPGEVIPDKQQKFYTMEPNTVRAMAIDEVKKQGLVGVVPVDGPKYGIKTGSAEEWAGLITGLAAHESGLNNKTVGDKTEFAGGSQGLLQLSRHDAGNYGLNGGKDFTDDQLRDPATNMSAGVAIIKSLVNKTGSIQKGMGQYWGPVSKEGWTPGNGRDRNLPWKEWQSGENGGIVPLPGVDGLPGRPQSVGPDTDVKRFILSSAIPVAEKMTLVTNSLLTQLDAGNSKLYDSIGGVEFLKANGATPDQVRAVVNGFDKYKKDRANKFNMDRASWEGDLINRMNAGATTLEQAKAEVQKKYDEGVLTDSGAYAMVAKAVAIDAGIADNAERDAAKKAKDAANAAAYSPEYMQKKADILERMKANPYKYNAQWADTAIREAANELGVSVEHMQQDIGRAWAVEEQARETTMRAVEKAAADKAKTDAAKANAKAMYTAGLGGQITGNIGEVSAQQWAIDDRSNQLAAVGQQSVQKIMQDNPNLTMDQALAVASKTADTTLYTELYKMGVVHEKVASHMTGALSGNIVGPDGKVTDGAMEAFNDWKKFKAIDVTGAYGSRYINNDEAKNTILLAEKFYDGGLDAQMALRKAAQYMQENKTALEDASTLPKYATRVKKHIDDNFSTLYGDGGILSKMFWNTSSISDKEREWAKNDYNMDKFKTAVKSVADVMYSANPTMDPDIITQKAVMEVVNRTHIVGGNLIVPRSNQPEYDLKIAMFGDTAGQFKSEDVDAAVYDYIAGAVKEGMPDNPAFAKEWKERSVGWFGKAWKFMVTDVNAVIGPGHQDTPPYLVQYDQRAGYISVQLYTDNTRGTTIDPTKVQPVYIPVDRIGSAYRAARKQEAEGSWNSMWRTLWTINK